jgi:hypothetical protein
MYTEIILLVVLGLILLGLARTTESVLDVRQKRRDQGDDPKIYL